MRPSHFGYVVLIFFYCPNVKAFHCSKFAKTIFIIKLFQSLFWFLRKMLVESPNPFVTFSLKPSRKLRRLTPSFGSILAVRLKKIIFRNKTFLFFKIESWNFRVQFEIEFRETPQNFNSFSLFRQLLFSFFLSVVWLSWNFVRFHKF